MAQKLVDAKVAGVVGHLNSGTTIPASKLYSDAGIPQISPSATNPKYTLQGFKTAFRVMANDVQQGSVIGKEAVSTLGAKKIAIIDDKTAYGAGLAEETEKAAKAAGATIVAHEFTNDKATDFKAILTKIKAKSPDLIMYGGMDAQGGPMVKQMKELGIKAKFIAGDGVCSAEWPKLAGGAAEGEYCTQAGVPPEKMANAKDFVDAFHRQVRPDPGLRAVFLRRGDDADRGDAEGELDRPGEVSARACEDLVRRHHGKGRIRRARRHQERRDHAVHGQGRRSWFRWR